MNMLLDKSNTISNKTTQNSPRKACFNATILVAPDSPTFHVVEEPHTIIESISLSDLALILSAAYVKKDADTISCTATVDGGGVDVIEDDTSLILARNHLSASSFSNWEIDPEDGSFQNSNQLLFPYTTSDDDATSESPKKRVHFMADPTDSKRIYCEQFDCPITLTTDDVTCGWYKASEIQRFRRHVHKDARALRSLSSSVYVDKFLQLHRSCARSIPITQSSTQKALAASVSSSRHRGQETLIFYEIFHDERKQMSNEVLLAQAAGRERYNTDELSEMLASVSKALSRRPRRFAYMTGLGDAEIAWKHMSSAQTQFLRATTSKQLSMKYLNNNDETSTTELSTTSEETYTHIEI